MHRGGYVSGLETSSFTPCAAEYEGEQWWLDADSASWARLERVMDRLRPDTAGSWVHAEAFVAVRGSVTDRGEYGHVGAYDRRIRVTEVLEAVPADSASCP